MTLIELRKHKVFFATMCFIVFAIGVFIAMRGANVGATYDASSKCKVCNNTLYHNTSHADEKSASCIEEGKEVWECDNCKAVYYNTLPALGHYVVESEGGTKHKGTCTRCGEEIYGEHVAKPRDKDNYRSTVHYDICSICNMEFNWQPHTSPVSCSTNGSCEVCNYTAEKIDCVVASEGVTSYDETTHTGTCKMCGKENVTVEHGFDDLNDPNRKCLVCGYTAGTSGDSSGDITQGNCTLTTGCTGTLTKDTSASTAATCTVAGKTVYKCSVCGKTTETTIPAKDHQYAYAKKGDTTHYKGCEKCSLATIEEPHTITYTFGDVGHRQKCDLCGWKADPSKDEKHYDNDNNNKCDVCGYSMSNGSGSGSGGSNSGGSDSGNNTCEHTYALKSDDTKHWQECSKCGDKKDEEEHKITTWAKDVLADGSDAGTHSGTCTVCDTKVTQAHTYPDTSNETNKCTANGCDSTAPHTHQWEVEKDDTYHWQKCKICDIEKENSRYSHSFGTWKDNENGTHSSTCAYEGCGYVATRAHTFENGVCSECGAIEEGDDECEHTYTKVRKDDEYHWLVCSKCNEMKPNSKEAHIVEDWKDNGDGTHSATCTFTGCGHKITKSHEYENGICKDCDAKKPEETTEDPETCEHQYDKIMQDTNYHWVICSKCNSIKSGSKAEHTPGTWKDNEDGTHSTNCTYTGCNRKLTQAHNYENGVCTKCGAKVEEQGNGTNNDNNNSNNNNNNNNNNNSSNSNNNGGDNTIADKEIPKTGKIAMAGTFVTLIAAGAYGFTKFIKYRNI